MKAGIIIIKSSVFVVVFFFIHIFIIDISVCLSFLRLLPVHPPPPSRFLLLFTYPSFSFFVLLVWKKEFPLILYLI